MLRQEWQHCTECNLGKFRQTTGGALVFGTGVPNQIMLIGEGPGRDEEREGHPFAGKSGILLRHMLRQLEIESSVYMTSLTICRSCAQDYDSEGRPKYWDGGRPAIMDKPPSPVEIAACSSRLMQEIYLVDPVIIVVFGATAAEALLNKTVMKANDSPTHVLRIPGAAQVASITDKKKLWARKVKGQLLTPTTQNVVEYLALPTLHPAFVYNRREDNRPGAPLETLYRTLELARNLYQKYNAEVLGYSVPPKPEREPDFQYVED